MQQNPYAGNEATAILFIPTRLVIAFSRMSKMGGKIQIRVRKYNI